MRMLYEPRGAQIEALCALENSRAREQQKDSSRQRPVSAKPISRHLILRNTEMCCSSPIERKF